MPVVDFDLPDQLILFRRNRERDFYFVIGEIPNDLQFFRRNLFQADQTRVFHVQIAFVIFAAGLEQKAEHGTVETGRLNCSARGGVGDPRQSSVGTGEGITGMTGSQLAELFFIVTVRCLDVSGFGFSPALACQGQFQRDRFLSVCFQIFSLEIGKSFSSIRRDLENGRAFGLSRQFFPLEQSERRCDFELNGSR